MIYKFKSKAAGDLIMLGREPAPTGIFEPADMPAALEAIRAAIDADEQARAEAEQEAAASGTKLPPRHGVSPRQRWWPIAEMMRRARAAGEPIVWGV